MQAGEFSIWEISGFSIWRHSNDLHWLAIDFNLLLFMWTQHATFDWLRSFSLDDVRFSFEGDSFREPDLQRLEPKVHKKFPSHPYYSNDRFSMHRGLLCEILSSVSLEAATWIENVLLRWTLIWLAWLEPIHKKVANNKDSVSDHSRITKQVQCSWAKRKECWYLGI